MSTYEYKLDGTKGQYAAIEEAIRIVQFILNKCLRIWMDGHSVSKNDLQCYCAELARDFPFAARLNSQARQAGAKALEGTVGQTGTAELDSANAWGELTTTALGAISAQQVGSWNQGFPSRLLPRWSGSSGICSRCTLKLLP
jgi:hypothetical protein